MTSIDDELQAALHNDRYPRSSRYDARWLVDNLMGPHPLWMAESLTQVMRIEPGMRVLDLGCGSALTSIFLAREFDVQVWALDLWTEATDNWARIREAGLAGQVHPVNGDARSLPFAEGFFDAIISVDAYQYFGTDVRYLPYCLKFLDDAGQIGMISPGLRLEPGEPMPEYLVERWNPDMCTYLSPQWWRTHWERTGLVTVERADVVEDSWRDWLAWLEACDLVQRGFEPDASMLRADQGRLLGFTRITACQNQQALER